MLLSEMYARYVQQVTPQPAARTYEEIQTEIDEVSRMRQDAWKKRTADIANANPYLGVPRDPKYTSLMSECEIRLKQLEVEKRAALAREQRSV